MRRLRRFKTSTAGIEHKIVRSRLTVLLLSLVVVTATGLGLGLPIGALADATYTACPTFAQFRHEVESIRSGGTITFLVSGCSLEAHHAIVIKPHHSVTIRGDGLAITTRGGFRNPSHFPLVRMKDWTWLELDHVTLEFGQYGILQNWNKHSTIRLINSSIYGNREDGIYQGIGNLILENSTFSFNGSLGISQLGVGSITMTNSSIFDGGGGIEQFGGSLTMVDSSIHNNNFHGVFAANHVTLTNSTINNNAGSGILDSDNVVLTDSTITGNTGDGITQDRGNSITATSSTISGNLRSGITQHNGGATHLTATMLADNAQGNCDAPVVDDFGYNLSSDSTCFLSSVGSQSNVPNSALNLGTLGDYGGPTQTIPLMPGSVAIDAIPLGNQGCAAGANVDQRGVTRPQGPRCDIGAYEWSQQDKLPTTTITTPLDALAYVGDASVTLSAAVKIDCSSYLGPCPIVDQGTVLLEVLKDGTLVGSAIVAPVSGGHVSGNYPLGTGLTARDYTIKAQYEDASGPLASSSGTAVLTIDQQPPASTAGSGLTAIAFGKALVHVAVATGPSGGPPTGDFSYSGAGANLSAVHLESLVVSGNHATLYGRAYEGVTPVSFEFDATESSGLFESKIELRLSTGYDSGQLSATVTVH